MVILYETNNHNNIKPFNMKLIILLFDILNFLNIIKNDQFIIFDIFFRKCDRMKTDTFF
jgi:hypothetical protein